MIVKLKQLTKSIAPGFLILLLLGFANMDTQADESDLSQATFYVYWYDVGKAALEGLAGVKNVENGWHNSKEINRVSYDPDAVSIDEMEAVLKKADTYQGTVGLAGDKWRMRKAQRLAGRLGRAYLLGGRRIIWILLS